MKSKRKLLVKIIKIIVSNCHQITFVTFNVFFPLSENPQHPVLNGQWVEHQTKLNEKYISFLHCISSLEGTSY